MSYRQIDYPEGSDTMSEGRNGLANTIACEISCYGGSASIRPFTSKGAVQRCSVGVPSECLGELGLACLELYAERATVAEREELMRRLAALAVTPPAAEGAVDEDTGGFRL